jgi:hypothetical protein
MPVDMSSIQATLGSLASAIELIKAILQSREATLKHEKAAELLGVLISAQSQTLSVQSQLAAAIEEIRQLKERIAQMEQWAHTKARYALNELAPGVFVYTLKAAHAGEEPIHHLCTRCYEEGFQGFLHPERVIHAAGMTELLICNRCASELLIRGERYVASARPMRR